MLLLILEGFLGAASARKAGGDGGGEAQDAGSGPPEMVGLNHTKEVERRTSGEAAVSTKRERPRRTSCVSGLSTRVGVGFPGWHGLGRGRL